jgi:hypothetical protein
LGVRFYGGVAHLLDYLSEGNPDEIPMPQCEADLVAAFNSTSYINSIELKRGALEIETDDDEMDQCQYFFDSTFAKRNPKRIAFLIHKGWMPVRVDKSIRSRPKTYLFARYPSQSCDSANWDFFELQGHRLERIGKIRAAMNDGRSDCHYLKGFLDQADPELSWQATTKNLAKDLFPFAGNLTEHKCSRHICQINHHQGNWFKRKAAVYSQLLVFDDLWAKSHSELFQSMRRFQRGKLLF